MAFEIVVDDYAEVWVNGKAPFVLGQNGGSVAAGWNAPNRVVLTKNAQPGELFFDLTTAGADDAIDGIKVDKAGNLFVSGPGGLWILSPEGKHLGTLHGPEHPHNMAWGDADQQTLYLAAQTGIYRIRLNNRGALAFAKGL